MTKRKGNKKAKQPTKTTKKETSIQKTKKKTETKILSTKKQKKMKKPKKLPKKSTAPSKIQKEPVTSSNKNKKVENNSNNKNINYEKLLDEAVTEKDRYILVEANPPFDSKFYSVTLNYTNVKNNNNKFYKIQLLQDVNSKKYGVLFRWGRVGRFGQVNYITYENFDEALLAFQTKLENKLEYGYIRIKTEINLNNDNDIEKNDDDSEDENLEKPLANLIKLIFDIKNFNLQMKTEGYDSDKIPLGQLSLEAVKEGYKYLKEIEKKVDDKNKNRNDLYNLSSKYYTLIPHNFGMYHMSNFVIDSNEKIQKENELLQSIKNVKMVSNLLQKKKENSEQKISLLSKLNELSYTIKIVPKTSSIYTLIEKYLSNSNTINNSPKIILNDLFELNPKNNQSPIINFPTKNKKLLWYGTKTTNFVSLLKNGFELPSPDSPIFSYMFGKGIYFSDIAIKSFYNSKPQNNIGLMLLCEVNLGKEEEKIRADIKLPGTMNKNCNSVKVLGMNFPDVNGDFVFDEDGLIIPLGNIVQNIDENKKTFFDFNEYVVYNIDQIKIRYITKVQFDK